RAEDMRRFHPEAILAELRAGGVGGVVYDASFDPGFTLAILEVIGRRRQLAGSAGRLVGVPTPLLRKLRGPASASLQPKPLAVEQSNTSIAVGERLLVKVLRRVEPGIHPAVELGRFLGERAGFSRAALVGGAVEYRPNAARAAPLTVVTCEQYLANEGDGWSYVIDTLRRWLEETLARPGIAEELRAEPPADLLQTAASPWCEPGHPLTGPHREWARELGRLTAELHAALASSSGMKDIDPEPLGAIDRQALFHGAKSLLRRSFRQARPLARGVEELARALDHEAEISARFRRITQRAVRADRIRVHGDFHLGQVLWSGKDFSVIDFEGEPGRSLGQRRLKRSAFVDVAGMVRSLHYAAHATEALFTREGMPPAPEALGRLLVVWYRSAAAMFLGAYLEASAGAGFVPEDRAELAVMLDFCLLEKAVYEVGYEANTRPDWVHIPALGILELLELSP
ncbi:MAG: phosphotransferase, partial [Acidimicrobiales bacterium]